MLVRKNGNMSMRLLCRRRGVALQHQLREEAHRGSSIALRYCSVYSRTNQSRRRWRLALYISDDDESNVLDKNGMVQERSAFRRNNIEIIGSLVLGFLFLFFRPIFIVDLRKKVTHNLRLLNLQTKRCQRIIFTRSSARRCRGGEGAQASAPNN